MALSKKAKLGIAAGATAGVVALIALLMPRRAAAGGVMVFRPRPQAQPAQPSGVPEDMVVPPGVPPPTGGATRYLIPRDGHGLTWIADNLLGTGDRTNWHLALWIYDLNRDPYGPLGPNINIIHAGDTIWIPTRLSVQQAPPRAVEDWRRRMNLLKEVFRVNCMAPVGQGTINCTSGSGGQLPVGPDITNPTVNLPDASGTFSYVEGRY